MTKIIGCGGYVPENVVTNHDLAKKVDTSHDWIVTRTGIHQRHFALEGQATSDLAVEAAKIALKRAQVKPEELDLIIVATTTPDFTFPSTATVVQEKIGNTQGLAFDVSAVCAGYLLALNVAHLHLQNAAYKKALVIGAECLSRLLNFEDRSTCVLFGDGAGAVVLEKNEDPKTGILGIDIQSDGRYRSILQMTEGPGSTGRIGKPQMSGQDVFRHAVTKLADAAASILEKHHLKSEDVDLMIPHQANLRIIEGLAKRFAFSMEKVIVTVDRHANTSAASIPLALNDAYEKGSLKVGDMILHEAIGGGLVWGAGLVRF